MIDAQGKNGLAKQAEYEAKLAAFNKTQAVSGKLAKTGLGRAGSAMSGAKFGNIAGWGGAIADIGGTYMVNSGKWKRGGFGDFASHMGGRAASMAALGAQLGALAGPYAPIVSGILGLVGGIGGGIWGAFDANKNLQSRKVSEHGLSLQGNYTAHQLKQIRKYLEEGKDISGKLREKMVAKGDRGAIDEMERIREELKSDIHKVTIVGEDGRPIKIKGHAFGGVIGSDDTLAAMQSGEGVVKREFMDGKPHMFVGNRNRLAIGEGTSIIKPKQVDMSVSAPKPGYSFVSNKQEIGGKLSIDVGGDIRMVMPDGASKNIPIDYDQIAKAVSEKLTASLIGRIADTAAHGGRNIVPDWSRG
jgi:hypothetical protein